MTHATARLLHLVRRYREPAVVQAVRSTAAAVVSYVIALRLSSEPAPLTAPLTALLVVQVTLYTTLTTGIRRVNSVVAGVLLAIGFSALVGLTWWSLGLIILASLVVGRVVKAGEFVPEVAISAMLVLGVTRVADTAWDRGLETLIGAAVGLAFNVLFVPPVWVGPASEAITDLATRMRTLLLHIGEESGDTVTVEKAAARLHEARRLDNDIAEVDGALRQAEDSLRLNPRVREGLLFRLVLRTGLDTLEICAVVLRVSCRTLTDLARARGDEPLFPPKVALALNDLYRHTAVAVESFAQLITAQVSANAEAAESRLSEELATARHSRARLAALLPEEMDRHPGQWQLYGALLAEADRVLDELSVDKRSERLMEELDRHARARRERYPRLHRLARRARALTRSRSRSGSGSGSR
ncbi:FUSC family protein [Streptomyces antarcticus]|uniref:FUSC family protein n=1 Tax=Streptomyces antarcticus TaxID=2996458 RepID=UPI00226D7104|nr:MULTISPECIES: FUSC family protein [unclassified Streptomyces]MCY0944301.1 aromatic acid exporter family protein [Streptomyces sp. H34-AA3]MCZ4087377.1 aromatic acid exporter family protein [Streptomyces sp. H34-S5]